MVMAWDFWQQASTTHPLATINPSASIVRRLPESASVVATSMATRLTSFALPAHRNQTRNWRGVWDEFRKLATHRGLMLLTLNCRSASTRSLVPFGHGPRAPTGDQRSGTCSVTSSHLSWMSTGLLSRGSLVRVQPGAPFDSPSIHEVAHGEPSTPARVPSQVEGIYPTARGLGTASRVCRRRDMVLRRLRRLVMPIGSSPP